MKLVLKTFVISVILTACTAKSFSKKEWKNERTIELADAVIDERLVHEKSKNYVIELLGKSDDIDHNQGYLTYWVTHNEALYIEFTNGVAHKISIENID